LAIKILPDADYLRECFNYCPETGLLTWKLRPPHHFKNIGAQAAASRSVGKQPPEIDRDGYRRVIISRTRYAAHRVIYKWMTGEEPPPMLDHINGDTSDNRWANLRPAGVHENQWNRPAAPHGALQLKGVTFHKRDRMFQTQIRYKGRRFYLGQFRTKEEARDAYLVAAKALHGEFFNPG
jgi:hypothetical protein